jgi:7-cyano-7-deazaguanine reductase
VTKHAPFKPKHLGHRSEESTDELDLIPWTHGPVTVFLDATEFTSLCPVTGQPDFGRITIEYTPEDSIVETKSLKLYLRRFRDMPQFNEVIVASIADDFYKQVKPRSVTVTGHFNLRGGISPTAVVTRGEQ